MKLASFGSLLALTYTDKMNIYRHTSQLNSDGTKSTKLIQTALSTDLACRISFTAKDPSESSAEDINPIYLEVKVFCGPKVDVKKGDKLVVHRLDDDGTVLATYTGIVNMPLSFVTHKELHLVEVGNA